MTLLVSLWFLFCFVFIWDESVTSSFNQKYQKSFYSYDKNKLFSYDIIRGIQQAISIFFSFLWGINEGIKRKHILHSLVADQSTGFLTRSRVPPQCINSREIGRTCRQKWKIQHQNHDDYDFLITYKREPSMPLLQNCIGFKFSINIFWIKRMIHVHFWILIYLLELNYLFEDVKDVMNTQW